MSLDRKYLIIGGTALVLVILVVLFSTIGSVNLSLGEIISSLIHQDNSMVMTIVYKMRLPRNILAVLIGANLAVSGVLLQSVMKNPLADPGITGVSSGASVAAIIILLLMPQLSGALPLFAFVGGAIACALVFIMAWKNGLRPERIVLAGVAINTILGGFISLLSTLFSDRIQSAILWLNGSLATKTWSHVDMLFLYSLIGLGLSLFLIRSANVLQLGDESAKNLGFNVSRTRLVISAVAVFLAAISTAVVGIISFIGLIVPHIARLLMGSDHKYTIPFSMVLGAIVLLIADTLARTIGGSIEYPSWCYYINCRWTIFLIFIKKERELVMLCAKDLKVGYEDRIIIDNLNLSIKQGEIVSIIGPNGCGKSTLLKTLSRMISPISGKVYLEGTELKYLKNKLISQKICLLSQHNQAPNDLTVEQLVYYGRLPHKKWYEHKSEEDKLFIDWAIEQTGLTRYKDKPIGSLSGGERQRAYIAQALCQKPTILLLDEPTTYLDISYQLELMELIQEINKKLNITVVMVLHELNQASRYSNRLIIMKQGTIISDGAPNEIIDQQTIESVYQIQCEIDLDPISNKPRIHPIQTIKSA